MDIDKMLSVERRLGIKDSEIEDFLGKASAVEEAIRGMRDGTLDPANVKIEGIDTDEEIAEKARQKEKRLAEIKAKNEALALERKREERKRWWEGVEVMVPVKIGGSTVDTTSSAEKSVEEIETESFHQMRYNSNYSRWNEWVPADPATKLEAEEKARVEEKKRNEEFENNNKEFCDKYLNDMHAREQEKNKKIQGSDSSRLRGNNYFKHKKFDDALKCYMEALKDQPFDPKILINIVQVHIKQDNLDDALEFLARVLRVEPSHAKALSRKAYVLSGRGELEEALDLALTALKSDPDNADIHRQVVELELAVKTKKDEIAINFLKAKVCEGTMDSVRQSALTEEAIQRSLASKGDTAEAIKHLEEVVEFPILATGFKLIDDFATGTDADIELVGKCAALVKADANMRVYFRTSGALKAAVRQVKELGATMRTHDDSSPIQYSDKANLVDKACAGMQLLRASVVDEPANMVAITIDSPEFLQFVVDLLSADFKLSVEIFEFINLLFEQSFSTSLGILLSYRHAMVKVSDHLQSIAASTTLRKDTALTLSCLSSCLQFSRHYLFNESVKSPKFVFPLNKTSSAALVENLAISLQLLMGLDGAVESVVEMNLEALLGCSQYNVLRDAFGNSMRAVNVGIDVPCPTALHVIALLSMEKYRRPSYLPICLGVLMNICVSDNEDALVSIRDRIVQSGCLDLVVDIVTMSAEKRASMDTLVLARAAGLLARLTTSSLAADRLKDPVLYGQLCRRLAQNVALTNRSEKWITDECGYLIRIIATLPSLPPQCLRVAYEEKLVESILQVFPAPRLEMGEITPASVVLPPSNPVSAIVVGNAARCLMPLADDSDNGNILFKDGKVQGVEKLICSLANCSDIRVRKNIAILLAKGARAAEVRAKIERFRGMQMLVELQKSL